MKIQDFFKYNIIAMCLLSCVKAQEVPREINFLFFPPIPIQSKNEDGDYWWSRRLNTFAEVDSADSVDIVKEKIRQEIKKIYDKESLKVVDLPDFDLFFMGKKLENKPDWNNIKNTHKRITIKFIAPIQQYPQIGDLTSILTSDLIRHFQNLPYQDNMNQLDLIISSIPKDASTNNAINLIYKLKTEWKNLSAEEKRNQLMNISKYLPKEPK
ncbi:MAG: hypothetical protein WC436_04650 [Candidatus Babeliales bacterium]